MDGISGNEITGDLTCGSPLLQETITNNKDIKNNVILFLFILIHLIFIKKKSELQKTLIYINAFQVLKF
jgi:hypothetical protein